MTAQEGVVSIIGAGPGDPGLITAKGADLLRRADVVVYDRLVSPALLSLAPNAKLVYAGKEPDAPPESQSLINERLVEMAREGKRVARLKGGDPFVFGRGGEEAIALAEAGVRFEIVPGVTSAVAAPAYAGVPVTHRGAASVFTVVTGSEDPSKPDAALDWSALAKTPGTLVALMGGRNLPAIADALLRAGRDPETPACVTQWGTLPRQRTASGTLGSIAAKAAEAGIGAPSVIVVGETAALRPSLRWFDTGPLFGKRVLVTRSRAQASALSRLLAERGAEPVELPAIDVRPIEDPSALDAALAELGGFDWTAFTSANGVEAVFERLAAQGRDARAFASVKIAAIGPATADALRERGIAADIVPTASTGQSVADSFGARGVRGARIFLPRADIAPPALPDGLRRLGADVTEAAAYRTAVPADAAERAREALASGMMDAVTFTSASAARNLVALLGGDPAPVNESVVVSIGPATSAAARTLGIRVSAEAREHTAQGVVDAAMEAMSDG